MFLSHQNYNNLFTLLDCLRWQMHALYALLELYWWFYVGINMELKHWQTNCFFLVKTLQYHGHISIISAHFHHWKQFFSYFLHELLFNKFSGSQGVCLREQEKVQKVWELTSVGCWYTINSFFFLIFVEFIFLSRNIIWKQTSFYKLN